MRVKVCGLTNEDDVRAACDLGAWAVGMILSPRGPRALDLARAERVRRAATVLTVGVFVDEKPEHVARIARTLALDLVQLHGKEPPDDLWSLSAAGVKAIKAFTMSEPIDPASYATAFAGLFDTGAGTGRTFDWKLLEGQSPPSGRLILAGGLRPENVALAVSTVHPFAVDVSSGVEASPGKKDRAKLEAFFSALGPAPRGPASLP